MATVESLVSDINAIKSQYKRGKARIALACIVRARMARKAGQLDLAKMQLECAASFASELQS